MKNIHTDIQLLEQEIELQESNYKEAVNLKSDYYTKGIKRYYKGTETPAI
jgi:hypothetical protein